MEDVPTNLRDHVFFHGTTLARAEAIIAQGFRVWHDDPDIGRYAYGGNLGNGIYLSCSWSTSLWFGRALLRVTLRPGTRVLDASPRPDRQILRFLTREFGREILEKPPWKVLPSNKKLERRELVELFRHQYWKTWGRPAFGKERWEGNFALLGHYRSVLIRYGYHAYGHPTDDNGVVVFAEDRIELREFLGAVPPEATGFELGHPPYASLQEFRTAATGSRALP